MSCVSRTAIIFAGPSLPPAVRPSDPVLEWRRQSSRARCTGRPDLPGDHRHHRRLFRGDADGLHKEILWAMAQGIHVYGGASIGALRAAELHRFGMTGAGRVFADYRDGILTDDDEGAVLHGPEELVYPAVTEAMVNIRATFEQARAEGAVPGWLAFRLIEIGEALFYKERSWETVFRLAAVGGLPPGPLADLVAWLLIRQVDQKRIDAVETVESVRAHFATGVMPLTVSYRFQDTGHHKAAARQATI